MRRIDGKDGRTYEINHNGELLVMPSVTTILNIINKPYLVPWAAKKVVEYVRENFPPGTPITEEGLNTALEVGQGRHKAILEHAGNFGTQAHDLIEARIMLGRMPAIQAINEKVRACVEEFDRWWTRERFVSVETEMVVYSPAHLYAGTMDCLACREGEEGFTLLDWKTSNYYSTEYALQTVAYKKAYEEVNGIPIGDIYIVRIGKEDAELEVQHVPAKDHDMLFKSFLAARDLWQWKKDYKAQGKRERAKAEAARQQAEAQPVSRPEPKANIGLPTVFSPPPPFKVQIPSSRSRPI